MCVRVVVAFPLYIPQFLQYCYTMAPERKLPTFDELPNFHHLPGCAWEVWGKGDQLGTVNLLTESVVAEAAKEIKYVALDRSHGIALT